MGKRFIVTGGNGYIGQHMCKLLHQLGHEVHIFDNFITSPNFPVHSYGTFHHIDIVDSGNLLQELKPIDAVFHFAARSIVSESECNPLLYYYDNVIKSFQFVDLCIKANIPHFVFSSTCATYGLPQTPSLCEEHPQNPVNSYGQTKKIIELFLKDLAQKELLKVLILRYFNVAGLSPDGELGEHHTPETHLIPNLCRSFMAGANAPFSLFGDQYPTHDGTCIRDYIHVDDLVRAHYDGYLYLQNKGGVQDFNLGSEKGYSVKEVLHTFNDITAKELPFTIHPPRAGDPAFLIADSRKIKKEINFTLRYTLKDCLQHTLNWWKKHGESHGNRVS